LVYQGVEGFFPLGKKAYHADEKVLICFSQQNHSLDDQIIKTRKGYLLLWPKLRN